MAVSPPNRPGFRSAAASYFDAALVIKQMARCCGVTAWIVFEVNMGAVVAIMAYGTDEQRRIAAEHVLSGDKPATCITEPGAGSTATLMIMTAVRDSDSYTLNGTKRWIIGGGVCACI